MASRPSGANAGIISLGAKFATLARSVRPSELKTALRLGALLIANEAKIRAPFLSGDLKRSIGISITTVGGKLETRIGSNLEYARRIEFGFTGEDKLGRFYDQPGQPYLRPAFKAKKKAAVKEIMDVLKLQIRRAVGSR